MNEQPAGYTFTGYTGDVYCAACDHEKQHGTEIPKLQIGSHANVIGANAILAAETNAPGTYESTDIEELQTLLGELETLAAGTVESDVLAKLGEIGEKVEAMNPIEYVTVIFTVDGAEVDRQTIRVGTDATAPEQAEYINNGDDHKHFSGWTGSYTNVTENVTITASYVTEPHAWVDGTVTLAATCVATGTQNQSCACGATNVKTLGIDSNNHTGNNTTAIEDEVAATCTEDGSYNEVVRCECGVALSSTPKTTTRLGHNFETYVFNDDATCEEDGTETATCTRCDETDTRTVSGTALGHDWGEWVVTLEATCTAAGSKTRTCTRDGSHTETEAIPMADHVDANTDGRCDVCGAEVEVHHHTDSDFDNTCDTCGQTIDTGFRCSLCNQNDQIAATGSGFTQFAFSMLHLFVHAIQSFMHFVLHK